MNPKNTIARIWYGWTSRENADKYERMLREEVLLEIAKRSIPGYKGAEIFIREGENDEMEFITLLRFETLDGVKIFAGKNYETPVIPPECKKLLKRHSEKSRHYRIVQIN
jgi:antibiotic biosynthesis monooxygenase (ABM) superfamily enzyme